MQLAERFASIALPELEKQIGHFAQQKTLAAFLNFELTLHHQLQKFVDQIVAETLLTVLTDTALVQQSIQAYRAKGYRVEKRRKTTAVQFYGGTSISLETVYMLPRSTSKRKGRGRRRKQGKGIYPVLKMLGITHRASPAFANEVTLSALNNPFAEATANFKRHGLALSEKRVRTLSESVGQAGLAVREAELEQFREGRLPAHETFVGQRVVIAMDGGRTCMRHTKKGRIKSGRKRHGFFAEWREPKVFTLYAIDEKGRKRAQPLPVCDGTHRGRDDFKLLLKKALHQTGVAQAAQIIFIGDGAPWVWNMVAEIITELNLAPKAVTQILDYYHACENLWKVIDALATLTQKQKARLFKKAKAQLRAGQIENLIERLGQKAEQHTEALKALRYFHGHESRCRYDLFFDQNLPLGSGAIESAIRRVVNLRLKGAGMFWLEHNAEAFLHLRCQLKTGRWDECFQRLIER